MYFIPNELSLYIRQCPILILTFAYNALSLKICNSEIAAVNCCLIQGDFGLQRFVVNIKGCVVVCMTFMASIPPLPKTQTSVKDCGW